MNNLKQLVEDFIEYTRTWSISETEWYYNVDDTRKTQDIGEDYISQEEFERAIREDILYCFIYNIDSIKRQMEDDLCVGYDEEHFIPISIDMENKIKKIFKDFKIDR